MKLSRLIYSAIICALLMIAHLSTLQAEENTPTGNLKGRILDGETKEPLVAVYIEILNTI